uniref:Ribosomal protein S2 n=1 Tax=Chorda asiatica TaxID=1281577 RepID=A0A8F0K117_9PHAE|nr:ribosomal protein S2 [Chorda asiatica]QWK44403.1 ribosomal protein S2 [Chorda asiatica]WBP69766.1 ribosomal protein S2 [Chorda asiatica]
MLRTEYSHLLSFFIRSSGYLVPRPLNGDVQVSKTMHPYLLGKRHSNYFYNLEKSLYGIRATLEVLTKIIGSDGKILLVSDSPLFKFCSSQDSGISYMKWKRNYLSKSKKADLVLLNDIEKENLVEAHRKCLLLVGVGSPTMSQIAYPFNLNVESLLLSGWFFSAIYTTCARGRRMKSSSGIIKPFSSLLGGGSSKKVSKEAKINVKPFLKSKGKSSFEA